MRPLMEYNPGQYFLFLASDVWSDTIHILERKETLAGMPRKMGCHKD